MVKSREQTRLNLLRREGRPMPLPKTKRRFPERNIRTSDGKTAAMLLVESELGQPLERILTSASRGKVAKRLGLDKSTVSKWRKRLGLV